jgi:uncharacterized protein YceK
MKTLFLALIVTLLAGCSGMGMGMQDNTSGGMGNQSSSSGASGDDYRRDDGTHSWRN